MLTLADGALVFGQITRSKPASQGCLVKLTLPAGSLQACPFATRKDCSLSIVFYYVVSAPPGSGLSAGVCEARLPQPNTHLSLLCQLGQPS